MPSPYPFHPSTSSGRTDSVSLTITGPVSASCQKAGLWPGSKGRFMAGVNRQVYDHR